MTRHRYLPAVVLALVVTVGVPACADDADDTGESTTTSTETAPTTTEPAPSTTGPPASTAAPDTTAAPVDQAAALAGLPWATPDDAHADPIAAVEAFVDWAEASRRGLWGEGEGGVEIGDFAQGDARSGEVVVTFTVVGPDGPVPGPTMTVLVRQAGPGDTWWVLGSIADSIVVDEPLADATVASPLTVIGENTAITDPIEVRLYAEGDAEPIVDVTITGGGVFAQGPFSTVLGGDQAPQPGEDPVSDWQGPAGGTGTLVVGTNLGVTTVPVVFAG